MSLSRRQLARAHGSRIDEEAEDAAADWIARCNGGDLSPDEQSRLHAWLAADPSHSRAFQEMETVWRRLNEPRRVGCAQQLWNRPGAGRRRHAVVYAWAAAGLAAAALLLLILRPSTWQSAPGESDLRSIVIRPDARVLPDGSTVELNQGSEIAADFSAATRGVRLLRGEALFVVMKDAKRPFVVGAGGVEVRAVGTAFAVRHELKQINVLVTEGEVAVGRARQPVPATTVAVPAADAVYLGVGNQVEVPVDVSAPMAVKIRQMSAAEVAAALAWRGRRMEFTDTPFTDAVKLFNRHNRVQLVLDDPAIGRRLLTGIFWADDPDGFARLVEMGFNVRAERSGDVITLHSR